MITYAVRYGGRWHVLDAGPGVMIAFEDEFGQSLPDGPSEGGHMWRHVAWIAYRVLKPEQPFDEWVETLTDLTGDEARLAAIKAELEGRPQEEEKTEDPTPLQAARGAGG